MATSKALTKEEVIQRRAVILNFIYSVGKVVIRHILKTEFENYHVAKNYMRGLEKKGLLKSQRAFVTGEKVFYITKLGVEFLQTYYPEEKYKYTQVRININNLEHDLIVTDILINILTKGIETQNGKLKFDSFVPDKELQQKRWKWADGNKKFLYRVPDMQLFEEKGKDNKSGAEIIVEYEHTRRPATHIENDFDDYIEHFRSNIILIVCSNPERMDYYRKKAYQYLRMRKNVNVWVGYYDLEKDNLEYYSADIHRDKKEEKKEVIEVVKKEIGEANKDIGKALRDCFGTTYPGYEKKFIEIYNETKKTDRYGYKDYFDTAFIRCVDGAKKEYQENKHLRTCNVENILMRELQRSGIMPTEVKK
jgi:predicted transcriptional regulator